LNTELIAETARAAQRWTMSTADVLPPLYAKWMDEMLGAEIPPESNATCGDCAMVLSPNDAQVAGAGFSASTKCCTFLPDLWNFLVGRALIDDDPASVRGRAGVEARIDAGIAVTPLGLRRSRSYQVLYDSSHALFGQSKAMLCPHYVDERGGLCGVWRHRESTCTTWFCKFVRGSVGRDFWNQLQQLLRAVEESLSTWCLTQMRVDEAVLRELYRPHRETLRNRPSVHEVDGDADAAELRAVWGTWRGREREFYVACARLVDPLSWNDIMHIAGAHVTVYARLTREAHGRLVSNDVPARPRAALVQITPRGERVRLATYSTMDELEVSPTLAKLLAYFDGRPISEALASIEEREHIAVDLSLVRKLADFGVLRDDAVA
jgi:hypothetical protein